MIVFHCKKDIPGESRQVLRYVDQCIISVFLQLKVCTLIKLLHFWNLLVKNTSSVKFREISVVEKSIKSYIDMKLVALTIFVKYGAAIINYHPIIKKKLRFLYQNHRAYSNIQINSWQLSLCFHWCLQHF